LLQRLETARWAAGDARFDCVCPDFVSSRLPVVPAPDNLSTELTYTVHRTRFRLRGSAAASAQERKCRSGPLRKSEPYDKEGQYKERARVPTSDKASDNADCHPEAAFASESEAKTSGTAKGRKDAGELEKIHVTARVR
jgi:hypothetical protein